MNLLSFQVVRLFKSWQNVSTRSGSLSHANMNLVAPNSLHLVRMKITRREYLSGLGAAALSSVAPGWVYGLAADNEQPTLREAAAHAGLVYGSCSDNQFGHEPEAYKALFLKECALYAGILAWKHIAPDPTHEDDSYDPNVAVALDAGLRLTGAHLLWYEHTPAWLETLPREQAQAAAAAHIKRIAEFYRGRCFSWNVVNEAINPREHAADGLRVNCPLLRSLGPDYFEVAFRGARAADSVLHAAHGIRRGPRHLGSFQLSCRRGEE